MTSHQLAKFVGHRHCGSGNIMILGCHVILRPRDEKSCDKLKNFYTILMATKPYRVVKYNKELPSIKSRPFFHVV